MNSLFNKITSRLLIYYPALARVVMAIVVMVVVVAEAEQVVIASKGNLISKNGGVI